MRIPVADIHSLNVRRVIRVRDILRTQGPDAHASLSTPSSRLLYITVVIARLLQVRELFFHPRHHLYRNLVFQVHKLLLLLLNLNRMNIRWVRCFQVSSLMIAILQHDLRCNYLNVRIKVQFVLLKL